MTAPPDATEPMKCTHVLKEGESWIGLSQSPPYTCVFCHVEALEARLSEIEPWTEAAMRAWNEWLPKSDHVPRRKDGDILNSEGSPHVVSHFVAMVASMGEWKQRARAAELRLESAEQALRAYTLHPCGTSAADAHFARYPAHVKWTGCTCVRLDPRVSAYTHGDPQCPLHGKESGDA